MRLLNSFRHCDRRRPLRCLLPVASKPIVPSGGDLLPRGTRNKGAPPRRVPKAGQTRRPIGAPSLTPPRPQRTCMRPMLRCPMLLFPVYEPCSGQRGRSAIPTGRPRLDIAGLVVGRDGHLRRIVSDDRYWHGIKCAERSIKLTILSVDWCFWGHHRTRPAWCCLMICIIASPIRLKSPKSGKAACPLRRADWARSMNVLMFSS